MQAITTKFLGPTNFRGSRVKATCQAGSLTVSWDHALDSEANHDVAARMLAEKLGWVAPHYGRLVGGGLPDGRGNCYVFVKEETGSRPYRYEKARELLATAIDDLRILSGDKIGPSDASWQDVAGTCAVNLHVLAWQIEQARVGNVANGPVVFPSPDDLEDK